MPDSLKISVSQSNQLIETSYTLTSSEKKIILMAIAQIKKGEAITENTEIYIHALDYAKIMKLDHSTAYHVLCESAERLYERSINLIDGEGNKQVKNKFRWLTQVKYIPYQGNLMIRFSTPILPYIQQLAGRFTTYQLADIAAMKSYHAIRLYELLAQYKDLKKRTFTIKELRVFLDLESKYKAHKDFRKWVIDPAIKQINENTPLKVSFEQKKTGRKVTHVSFSIADTKRGGRLAELTGIGKKN